MVNREEIEMEFSKLSSMLSMEYIKMYNLISGENEAKENNAEFDADICEKGNQILMHLSHSMGELVEAKALIVEKLSMPDLLCKMQYESEMSDALEAYTKAQSFNDILNDK